MDHEQRYPDDYWDGKAGSLESSRILFHNDDYLEFLVTRVWRIDQPSRVVDFGCGYGRFGQMLLPLFPEGSTYTGFDQSADLIEKGRELWAGSPYQAEFSVGSVHDAHFADESFDIAISQAVLMHISDATKAIREMVRVTRHGGLVITCDTNRNAHNALLHIEELNTQETTPLDMLQGINQEIRRQTGVDHNIGVKTPVIMHKAGLKNVGARISDCVRLLFPPVENEYDEALFRGMCEQGLDPNLDTEEKRANLKAFLMKYGVSEEDADKDIEQMLAWDFKGKGRDYHTVYPSLLSFSFGTVEKGR